MKTQKLLEAYGDFEKKTGKLPDYLFTGGGLADAIPLGAFVRYARENDFEISGMTLNPYPRSQEAFFAQGALENALGEECFAIPSIYRDDSMASRSLSLITKTISTIPSISKMPDVEQDVSAWSLEDPFFLLAPSDGYISPHIVDFLFKLDRPIVYVLMDDGTGTFVRNNRELAMRGVDRLSNPIVRSVGRAYVHACRPFSEKLQSLLERKGMYRTFTLFSKTIEGFEVNQHVRDLYVRTLREATVKTRVEKKNYSNKILVAATKAELFGLEEIEILAIERLKSICDSLEVDLVLRPHPLATGNERYESLGVQIEEPTEVTSEALFSICESLPLAVVGFASSVQVNANVYFGVPSVSLEGLVKDELSEARRGSPAVKQFCENISRTKAMYPSHMSFPANEREFAALLEECKAK